jgi:plasmid stabilization system protein ParE
LKERRVRFTATSQGHVDRERAWWLENRDYRDLFATELEAATRLIAVFPGAGTPYASARVAGLRRLYLDKLGCHLYYTLDDNDVIVHAFWGARRERGPTLR